MKIMPDYKQLWNKIKTHELLRLLPLRAGSAIKNSLLFTNTEFNDLYYGIGIEDNIVEVSFILDGPREFNEKCFDKLESEREKIDAEFGSPLEWEKKIIRKKRCSIYCKKSVPNEQLMLKENVDWILFSLKKLYEITFFRLKDNETEKTKNLNQAFVKSSFPLQNLKIENFFNFKSLELKTGAAINLIIGENDTGKTGLMKLLYAVSKSWEVFSHKEYYDKTPFREVLGEKIFNTFQPRDTRRIGDLINKKNKQKLSFVGEYYKDNNVEQNISFQFTESSYRNINECNDTIETANPKFNCVFIPAKEVLTAFHTIKYTREKLFLPGFDDTYLDLIKSLEVPVSLKEIPEELALVNTQLESLFEGKIQNATGEEPFVFIKENQKYSISITSEGIKKIGILSTLIRNQQISEGTILFIDEPETNLHPKAIRTLIDMIVNIASAGVQLFLASHSYVVINQLFLSAKKHNVSIYCHSLHKNEEGFISSTFSDLKDGLPTNSVTEEITKMFSEVHNSFNKQE